MLVDYREHLTLLSDIVALMSSEERAVWADPDLAAREADELLARLVL